MLPVSGSVTAPVSPLVVEKPIISASQVAEVGVSSASEQLTSVLTSTESNNQVEDISNVLQQHGLDTSDEDFLKSNLSGSLAKIKAANDKVGAISTDNKAGATATVEEIIAAQNEQVAKTAAALEAIKDEIERNRIKANYAENQLKATVQTTLQKIAEAEEAAKARTGDNEISVHTSYRELWAVIAKAITNMRTGYVDFYAGLMQKYTEMYEAYNGYVQKASADAVKGGEDGNNVNFSNDTMKGGHDKFNNAVSGMDLGSVANWDRMTDEQKASMTATLEPAFKVDQSSGKISFNLDQYNGRSHYPSDGGGKVSTSSYNSWLASFNAIGTGLQSYMQSFAQRYTQANSTFGNLNKVQSGAISTMADSAKDVFKALG